MSGLAHSGCVKSLDAHPLPGANLSRLQGSWRLLVGYVRFTRAPYSSAEGRLCKSPRIAEYGVLLGGVGANHLGRGRLPRYSGCMFWRSPQPARRRAGFIAPCLPHPGARRTRRSPRRRVARLSEIPIEARPLIGHLVEQRLLATDVAKDTGEKTIEPAHEALLRQWSLLLAEDARLLAVLDGVKRASHDWAGAS